MSSNSGLRTVRGLPAYGIRLSSVTRTRVGTAGSGGIATASAPLSIAGLLNRASLKSKLLATEHLLNCSDRRGDVAELWFQLVNELGHYVQRRECRSPAGTLIPMSRHAGARRHFIGV